MTIVKFTQHSGYTYYYTDWDGDKSGEYVPLAEYQKATRALLSDNEMFIAEIKKLQDLIQRVNEVADDLSDEMEADDELKMHVTVRSDKLEQLLNDCREVL